MLLRGARRDAVDGILLRFCSAQAALAGRLAARTSPALFWRSASSSSTRAMRLERHKAGEEGLADILSGAGRPSAAGHVEARSTRCSSR